ncbi:piezo-type mechanosensitive ion channel component isoform X4 [Chrysoperla carnea]|uniref:piezo-type mechanosensitive ion channel component isoform X4 n=1 Tax=Chrysoperla carnea TaxID=189513 RepID=UPI001D07F185|nr:piezo-type mechanosensitive ion channel component isoform X4 [Chrysoperla carnea]
MAKWLVVAGLQKIVLPTILLACTAFRPCLLSAIYLILLLVLPYIPLATKENYHSVTGFYLRLVMILSFLTSISQIIFQVVLFALPPYAYFLSNCNETEKILRHVGFIHLESIPVTTAVIWIMPEVLMVLGSVAIYVIIGKLVATMEAPPTGTEESGVQNPVKFNSVLGLKKYRFLMEFGRYISLLMLCIASSMKPSLVGAIYFITFIGAATWWASYRELQRGYAWMLKVIELIVVLQLLGIYVYQTQYIQDLLPQDSIYARLFGLEVLISVNCDEPRDFIYTKTEWTSYVSPITVYCMYFIIIQIGSYLRNPQFKRKSGTFSRLERASLTGPLTRKISGKGMSRQNTLHVRRWQNATRKVKLLRAVSTSHGTGSRLSASSRSGGDASTTDNIPMQPIGDEQEESVTCLETTFYAICSLLYVIIRSSYLATNIIMMTWSITFHSWLTFVLLLWANILWLFPNQRRSMLRSSPLLVLYAIFLLLSQYIYTLDLKETELPSKIQGYNLKQIGFYRPEHFRCFPIIIKSLFTCMFWVTMRQYMQERKEAKQNSAIADMVSPLQVTMGAAMSGNAEEMQENQFVKNIGIWAKSLLTKYWIWIVAGTLFLSGITGHRITGFRIIYMGLFLIFLFLFQASWRIWCKFMYSFWLIVIIYSMFILITVYTYQFDNFEDYWRKYLFIPVTLQNDIGLETYATAELFMRLLQPTFFVIISVIQMHYFHNDFLKMTKFTTSTDTEQTDTNTIQTESNAEATRHVSISADPRSEGESIKHGKDNSSSGTPTKKRHKFNWKKIKSLLCDIVDVSWVFFEFHMMKLILISAMIVCTYDVAAIHFLLVVMAVIAIPLGTKLRSTFRIVALGLVSIMLLLRMIYQIEYIHHSKWDVNCTSEDNLNSDISDNNGTADINDDINPNNNLAKWLGFQKLGQNESLFDLLKWYILYIMISTFATVVDIRQLYHRQSRKLSLIRPTVMFPNISRVDADKDTWHCLKYFCNYGYYKFGVECSLLGTATVVCFRTDIYAVIYGIWLVALCISSRERIQKMWSLYIGFIVIVIPLQYFCVVGLPPNLCIDFPWSDTELLRRIQDWFFLMDNKIPPPATKIILDFILLILLVRQKIVFSIEDRFDRVDVEYAGGSNKDIIKDADIIDFVNPVPDFVTTIKNWLDIWKRAVFIAFLWIILAIIFLTGTNRVNVFSIGYLIGTFIFLWQGSDLFLRPIANIVKIWEHLIIYNVFVIMMKASLQILGCIFIRVTESYSCWAIEMFGIGCIRYFSDLFANVAPDPLDNDERCAVIPNSDVSLNWDLACFACLIFQRRIFKSYYFFHIIDDTKAMTILASRGAELIEDLRGKHVKEQEEKEKLILENIKTKMDRIKENQRKIQGPTYKEPDSHYVDHLFRPHRPLYRKRVPRSYREAIRSGDYYMFDNIEDEEDIDYIQKQEESKGLKSDDVTLGELISTVLKTKDFSTKTIILHARSLERIRALRRASMPSSGEPLVRRQQSTISAPSHLPSTTTRSDPNKEEKAPLMSPSGSTEPSPSKKSGGKLTRKGSDETIQEDYEEYILQDETKTLGQKLHIGLLICWAFIRSALLSLTLLLNKFSKNYRFVSKVLTQEKKLLKEGTAFRVGIRRGPAQVWQPLPSSFEILHSAGIHSNIRIDASSNENPAEPYFESTEPRPSRRKSSNVTTLPEIRILAPSQERGLDEDTVSNVSTDSHSTNGRYSMPHDIIEDKPEEEMSSADQPVPIRLALAIWFVILSNSEIVCFFMVFLNQIKSASIISLPLPLMVFLWGTLTIPRPSKTFWVTMIAYVEVIVIIKCMFQFQFLPWNDTDFNTNPFFPPRILGILRKPQYAVYDLLLLLVIFFHRSMLKSLGLWKTSYAPIPHFGANIFHTDAAPLVTSSIKPSTTVDPEPSTSQDKDQDIKASVNVDTSDHEIVTPGGLRLRKQALQSTEQTVDEDGNTSVSKVITTAYTMPESSDDRIEEDDELVLITTQPHDHYDYFPNVICLSFKKHFSPFQNFFKALYDPTLRVATDVYAYMFMCDFFNFLVIIFGFSAFTTQQGDGGVQAYLTENKVPIPFLLMLILQFTLILIDRALFLRKFILGKIIFQFFSIIGVHIWMFFILPAITERQFNAQLPPQMWYMVKCFYLLLSAYQIRSGYPTRILGNFLCKGYNYINFGLFKGFMFVPFLFEIRTIMDWIWTDTSMTIFDWLKMEDIFANIFLLKCSRHNESEFPQERGVKKPSLVKYVMGGSFLMIIILIIWFPLALFALVKSVGLVNIPIDVTLEMRIGPYQSIYSMSAQSNQIIPFNHQKWSALNSLYVNNKDREATTFLSNYEFDDIAQVVLSGNSTVVWNISPPDLERLIEELNSTNTITVRAQFHIKRDPADTKNMPLDLTYGLSYDILAKNEEGNINPTRVGLMKMLKGEPNIPPITIPYMLPKFLKVTNLGEVAPVNSLLRKLEYDTVLRNITIQLSRSPASPTKPSQQWWEIREVCQGYNYDTYLNVLPGSDCNFIQIYMFNEKKFPATLSFISGGGIISLYTTLVFFASRFVRGFFSDQFSKIMFEDLPNVDRIMQLCLDIYLVRESRELTLEEDLFAKLVFLYRSPETLIKWTRPKYELEGDDSDRQPSIDN